MTVTKLCWIEKIELINTCGSRESLVLQSWVSTLSVVTGPLLFNTYGSRETLVLKSSVTTPTLITEPGIS